MRKADKFNNYHFWFCDQLYRNSEVFLIFLELRTSYFSKNFIKNCFITNSDWFWNIKNTLLFCIWKKLGGNRNTTNLSFIIWFIRYEEFLTCIKKNHINCILFIFVNYQILFISIPYATTEIYHKWINSNIIHFVLQIRKFL